MSLRPFTETDLEAVNQLHRSVWWPERSAAGWRWLMANPASAEINAPHGWVIDDGAGPQAFRRVCTKSRSAATDSKLATLKSPSSIWMPNSSSSPTTSSSRLTESTP